MYAVFILYELNLIGVVFVLKFCFKLNAKQLQSEYLIIIYECDIQNNWRFQKDTLGAISIFAQNKIIIYNTDSFISKETSVR